MIDEPEEKNCDPNHCKCETLISCRISSAVLPSFVRTGIVPLDQHFLKKKLKDLMEVPEHIKVEKSNS